MCLWQCFKNRLKPYQVLLPRSPKNLCSPIPPCCCHHHCRCPGSSCSSIQASFSANRYNFPIYSFPISIRRVLGLPHLTLPFILTSWAFLLFSTEMVIRPEKLSTPEEHLAQHKRSSWETMVLGALVRQSTALSVLPAAATSGGDNISPAAIDLQCLEDGTMQQTCK